MPNQGDIRGDEPFIIVGGGIGGAAAALALARKGIRSHVLEQSPAFREVGAGIQLPPNVSRMFDRLGVYDKVREVAFLPENLILMDAISGDIVIKVTLGEPFEAQFGYPYIVMHRGDLLEILLAACRETGLVTLSASSRVVSYEDLGRHVVVTTADGEQFKGPALIGCDGLRSLIRPTIIEGDDPLRTEGDTIFRGVVPSENIPEHLFSSSITMWGGPDFDFAHYPVRRGEVYNIGASIRSPAVKEGLRAAASFDELRERYQIACPKVRELLEHVDHSRHWVLYDRAPQRHWSKGRATLLGDAAHASFHYIAQGACMALEDAVYLADQVEANRGDPARAFQAYEDGRFARMARVQMTSRFFGDIYHAGGVMRDMRREMFSKLAPKDVYNTMSWLFSGI